MQCTAPAPAPAAGPTQVERPRRGRRPRHFAASPSNGVAGSSLGGPGERATLPGTRPGRERVLSARRVWLRRCFSLPPLRPRAPPALPPSARALPRTGTAHKLHYRSPGGWRPGRPPWARRGGRRAFLLSGENGRVRNLTYNLLSSFIHALSLSPSRGLPGRPPRRGPGGQSRIR